ncbi:hypothetical protein Scep_005215 [Stephania cephalantha]|uniref:Uncharacterized protein n=1 Tax=Stephania cephalantha TaxID=152367 RepID=A0AAP0KU38_9MAGN
MEVGLEAQLVWDDEDQEEKQLEREEGFGDFGCAHYRRRCKIRAPCCDEIFDCRHCHNEAKNSLEVDPLDRHDIPRHEITKNDIIEKKSNVLLGAGTLDFEDLHFLVTLLSVHCVTQNKMFNKIALSVGFAWENTFVQSAISLTTIFLSSSIIVMGVEYAELEGRRSTSIVIDVVSCCYDKSLEDCHPCVERAMHHNCPVCLEYLFDSTKDISVLQCGHTIHLECLKEMGLRFQFACAICSKSAADMSKVWEKFDQEIAATPMPETYLNKMVWILCNDCGITSEVNFHIIAHKCPGCKSYNTRQIRGTTASCSSSL